MLWLMIDGRWSMVVDGRWWSMVVDGSQWWSMVVDGGRWWSMVVDGVDDIWPRFVNNGSWHPLPSLSLCLLSSSLLLLSSTIPLHRHTLFSTPCLEPHCCPSLTFCLASRLVSSTWLKHTLNQHWYHLRWCLIMMESHMSVQSKQREVFFVREKYFQALTFTTTCLIEQPQEL